MEILRGSLALIDVITYAVYPKRDRELTASDAIL